MSEDNEPMRVDTELVRKLALMLDENDLSEIEVEDNGRRIVVKRKLSAGAPVAYAPAPIPAPAGAAAEKTPAPAAAEANPASHPGAVKSPMVGTAYLSAEPSAPPFVSAGQQVAEGDTLLIIEAMKTMNPIRAPKGGTVKQVLIANAQPVEYDQPLVIID